MGYLEEAIGSALAQTYEHIEVIVSDDGGNIEVEVLVDSFDDSRLRYRKNSSTLGQALNNRGAFSEAQGTYVANLHDDRWSPHFLSTLVPPLENHPNGSVAFSDHYVTNVGGLVNDERTREASRHFGRATLAPGLHQPFWEMALLNSTVPTVMASVMRRSSLDLEHIPPEVGPVYDRWLTYLLCRDGHAAYFHPEPLTYYRVHEAQESDGLSVNKCAAELYCSKQFVADSRLSAIRPQLQKMLHHHYVDLGIELLIEGRRPEGRSNLIKGIQGAPRRALPFLALSVLFSTHRVSSFIRTFRKEQKSLTQSFRAAFR